ncbi:GIY-YIG nuclease family protein [Vibrio owensii]|uniref:GIY-YIG nuclease family protein n=1 Tax=Vibrio owensii TaxID=696485 RepID=UPI003CC65603
MFIRRGAIWSNYRSNDAVCNSRHQLMEGLIYVMTNPAMPGLVKVGLTEDISKRLASLYTTGVPAPFKLEYQAKVKDMEAIEARIHKLLSKYRYNQSREFFTVSVSYAVGIAKETIQFEIDKERELYFDKFYSVWDCPIDNDGIEFK